MLTDLARRGMRLAGTLALPKHVVFHHVPKCGGTSVGRALRTRYLISQATVKPEESFRAFELFSGRTDREQMLIDVLDLREQMMMYHLFDDVRCISLHVRFSDNAFDHFCSRYHFITILREPVQRFLSHYYWSHGRQQAHARIEENLEAFLQTERARRLGATYAEYFSGLPKEVDFASVQAVEAAIKNLNRFDVVGRLDNLPDFRESIARATGARLRIGHENRASPLSTHRAPISDHVIQIIKKLCEPDLAIWSRTVGRGETSIRNDRAK